MPDPPIIAQTEVENTEAATTNATKANDSVMAEDNVEPEDPLIQDSLSSP